MPEADITRKRPGEIKVVAMLGGDYGHNHVHLEMHIRSILGKADGWRIITTLGSEFFTPSLISDADLVIISKHSRPDDIAWRGEGLADELHAGAHLWRDENVRAIIDNVERRGMGFLSLHSTVSSGNTEIERLLGVEPIPHNEVQPLWLHSMNREHPITRGLGNLFINLDEQFAAVITDPEAVTLFLTTAMHDKREAVGGWCRNAGSGRVAALLPGHFQFAYRVRGYQEILWRAAHWAINRDIRDFPGPTSLW